MNHDQYWEGFRAARIGADIDDNPYPVHSANGYAWFIGYRDATPISQLGEYDDERRLDDAERARASNGER